MTSLQEAQEKCELQMGLVVLCKLRVFHLRLRQKKLRLRQKTCEN